MKTELFNKVYYLKQKGIFYIINKFIFLSFIKINCTLNYLIPINASYIFY
jgi:hypothetical protein